MPRKAEPPPDIEIGARVKAKKLRFRSVPETEVRLSDGSRPKSERKNLPERVEPDVTYRDVEVTWRAEARVRAEQPSQRQGRTER
jgi:hypothetical protein